MKNEADFAETLTTVALSVTPLRPIAETFPQPLTLPLATGTDN
jgi:hypothetical protein